MNFFKLILFFLVIFLAFEHVNCQSSNEFQKEIKELKNSINQQVDSLSRAIIFKHIFVSYYYNGNYDSALFYHDSGVAYLNKNNFPDLVHLADFQLFKAMVYNKQKDFYMAHNELSNAKSLIGIASNKYLNNELDSSNIAIFTNRGLEIQFKVNRELFQFLMNIGSVRNAIKIMQNTANNFETIFTNQKKYNFLSTLYNDLGDAYTAIDYKKINDDEYFQIKLDSIKIGIEFYEKSLYYRKLNNNEYIGWTFKNLASTYIVLDSFSVGEKLLDSAQFYFEKQNDIYGLINTYKYKSRYFRDKGDNHSALKYAKLTENLISSFDFKTYEILYNTYRDSSLTHLALNYADVIINEYAKELNSKKQNQLKLSENRIKFIDQKRKDSIQNVNIILEEKNKSLIKDEQIKADANKRMFLYSGIGVLLLLSGIAFWSFYQKKKDNEIITHQKHVVEEKNKDIMDSVNYAQRIQSAILPPKKVVKKHLEDSFILYLPKDIVAGDFYWLETINNMVLFAVADCTGHGVPGAMVSVIGNNALNRSVREHGLSDPGKILDRSRAILIQEFEKSEEEVKDGMDIALCTLRGNELSFAGANNPLWILRNGELLETRGDSQPIGKFDHSKPFNTHEFELQKGDTIYIFSDGFADQFGGEKGKKFKKLNFKKLLLSLEGKPMDEQCKVIQETFDNWKGKIEQVDDVCVMGVRV